MIQQSETDMSYAAELKHFDDTYQAITAGYQESPTSKREVLDHIGSKLEAAKTRFYEVNQQSGQVPEDDLQLDQLLEEVRKAFRGLLAHGDSQGPPLA